MLNRPQLELAWGIKSATYEDWVQRAAERLGLTQLSIMSTHSIELSGSTSTKPKKPPVFVLLPLIAWARVPHQHTQVTLLRLGDISGGGIRYRGGGAGVFGWPFLFISPREMVIFFHLRIGCISTMPCGHLFMSPIFPTNFYFQKNSTPPPQVF